MITYAKHLSLYRSLTNCLWKRKKKITNNYYFENFLDFLQLVTATQYFNALFHYYSFNSFKVLIIFTFDIPCNFWSSVNSRFETNFELINLKWLFTEEFF